MPTQINKFKTLRNVLIATSTLSIIAGSSSFASSRSQPVTPSRSGSGSGAGPNTTFITGFSPVSSAVALASSQLKSITTYKLSPKIGTSTNTTFITGFSPVNSAIALAGKITSSPSSAVDSSLAEGTHVNLDSNKELGEELAKLEDFFNKSTSPPPHSPSQPLTPYPVINLSSEFEAVASSANPQSSSTTPHKVSSLSSAPADHSTFTQESEPDIDLSAAFINQSTILISGSNTPERSDSRSSRSRQALIGFI